MWYLNIRLYECLYIALYAWSYVYILVQCIMPCFWHLWKLFYLSLTYLIFTREFFVFKIRNYNEFCHFFPKNILIFDVLAHIKFFFWILACLNNFSGFLHTIRLFFIYCSEFDSSTCCICCFVLFTICLPVNLIFIMQKISLENCLWFVITDNSSQEIRYEYLVIPENCSVNLVSCFNTKFKRFEGFTRK